MTKRSAYPQDGVNSASDWDVSLDAAELAYLCDHRVQDSTILPGAAFVDLALRAIQPKVAQLGNVKFMHALILSETGAPNLRAHLVPDSDGWKFYCTNKAGDLVYSRFFLSSIVDADGVKARRSLDAIRDRCAESDSGVDFYAALSRNGNQYGPRFQGVDQIWRGRDEVLGRLCLPGDLGSGPSDALIHPVLLDACVQTLSATCGRVERTFLLEECDQIRLYGPVDAPCWCHALLTRQPSAASDALVGSLDVLDGSGHVLAQLRGVRLRYLEYARAAVQLRTPLSVAATFTAEPLKATLDLWGRRLRMPFDVTFAPYNQVFQQLLDPTSLLAKNDKGINVTLLRFEDLARLSGSQPSDTDGATKQRCLPDPLDRYTLPNQLEIAHINRYETEYLYQEIFEDQCYLKHGIHMDEGACVFDVGANIGMFSLFVSQRCKDARVYAFEPSPRAFEALATNSSLCGADVRTFNCGVSDQIKEAEFTFYERSSVFSSFFANAQEDTEAIRAVVRNTLGKTQALEGSDVDQFVDELMTDRLSSQSLVCQLTSISDVIREHRIDRIDLLKVDAEKSELDILRGISEGDWPKIRQIVLEVHDRSGGLLKDILSLLETKGFLTAVEEQDLLQHSGLFNVFARREIGLDSPKKTSDAECSAVERESAIKTNVHHLVAAFKSLASRSLVPHLLIVCPGAPDRDGHAALYREMEILLASELRQLDNVHIVTTNDLVSTYPVHDYYDRRGDQLGHVPYTPECFAALGTMIARKVHALQRAPYKVIVLDCDQTLWKGVCGEDGASGVEIDLPRRQLQEFMLGQREAGMLLCLCSKNSEEDVMAVFDHGPEMPLQRSDLVSWRINWKPKSENIRQLARELQLGLDSFVLIDDNQLECAEVRANCPDVLTLQLPADTSEITRFLAHVWAFDQLQTTDEDRSRTVLYQQNAKRAQLRDASLTLAEFLAGLELRVEIDSPQVQHLARVSQLTQRTNQFNFTTIRRSEAQIQECLQAANLECLICRVSDRFGDYGLTGLVLFKTTPAAIEVDTFLLSCRVLGRGVEHQMLAKLGQLASARGLDRVELTYRPTKKNQPALDFLQSVASSHQRPLEQECLVFDLPAERARSITYVAGKTRDSDTLRSGEQGLARFSARSEALARPSSGFLNQVAHQLHSAREILKLAAAESASERRQANHAYVAPGDDLQRTVAGVWQEVLGIDKVGISDNFLEVGGTSLQAVQLITKLQRTVGIELPIVNLFEHPTVASLAKMIGQRVETATEELQRLEDTRSRGRRRRQRRRSRAGVRIDG